MPGSPVKVRIVRISEERAAEVARLWRRCFPCLLLQTHAAWNPAAGPYKRASIQRRILSNPHFDPAGSFIALRGRTVAGFCIAAIGPRKPGSEAADGYISALAVDPRLRGQGLGSRLLNLAERWLKGKGARRIRTDYEGNPVPLLLGVPLDNQACCFFLNRGYRSYQRNFMQVMVQRTREYRFNPALRKRIQALQAQGIRVGPVRKEELPALDRHLARTFPSWREGNRKGVAAGQGVIVAVRAGRVLGFAGPYRVGPRGNGGFSAVGVEPKARGLGLGAVIFNLMCDRLKAEGARLVHLTTNLDNSGQEIYQRAAYRTRCVADCSMRKELP